MCIIFDTPGVQTKLKANFSMMFHFQVYFGKNSKSMVKCACSSCFYHTVLLVMISKYKIHINEGERERKRGRVKNIDN